MSLTLIEEMKKIFRWIIRLLRESRKRPLRRRRRLTRLLEI
jgi:hypothetical protein